MKTLHVQKYHELLKIDLRILDLWISEKLHLRESAYEIFLEFLEERVQLLYQIRKEKISIPNDLYCPLWLENLGEEKESAHCLSKLISIREKVSTIIKELGYDEKKITRDFTL